MVWTTLLHCASWGGNCFFFTVNGFQVAAWGKIKRSQSVNDSIFTGVTCNVNHFKWIQLFSLLTKGYIYFLLLYIFTATYTANGIARIWLAYNNKVKTCLVGGVLQKKKKSCWMLRLLSFLLIIGLKWLKVWGA